MSKLDFLDDSYLDDSTPSKEDVIEYLLQLDDKNWKKFISAMETRRAAEKEMDQVQIDNEKEIDEFLDKVNNKK